MASTRVVPPTLQDGPSIGLIPLPSLRPWFHIRVEGQVLQSHIDRAAGRGRKGVQFEDRNRSWLPRASRAGQDPAPISLVATDGQQLQVRSIWFIDEGGQEPRFVTVFPATEDLHQLFRQIHLCINPSSRQTSLTLMKASCLNRASVSGSPPPRNLATHVGPSASRALNFAAIALGP